MANEADFYITVGDTSDPLEVMLKDDAGNDVDLSGSIVRFQMAGVGSDSLDIDERATINDAVSGEATYNWSDGDTDTAGYYNARFAVEYDAVTAVSGETHTYSAGTSVYNLDNDRVLVGDHYDVSVEDASGDVYERGTDFEVVDDSGDGELDSIDWSVGGSSPDDSESFDVDYQYQTNSTFDPNQSFPNENYLTVKIDAGLV